MWVVKINDSISIYDDDYVVPEQFVQSAVHTDVIPEKPVDSHQYYLDVVDGKLVWAIDESYDLSVHIANRIADSKLKLAEYLKTHPLTWIDGNQYSVTSEKQTLLANQLTLYSVATTAGMSHELKWNTTGGKCVIWTYEDLMKLALAISSYVQPFINYQQAKELEMIGAKTPDELNAIIVNYGEVRW